jgi:hypothetical protein
MKQRRIAKLGMLAAIRYRRPLVRFAKSMAKNPKRTTRVTGSSRRAAIWAQQLRTNPKAQRQVKAAVIAASAAATRARKLGAARAVNDQTFLDELRAAAAAMASSIATAQAPTKKRRRIAKLVFGVGMVGAGAYAGYRMNRSRSADQTQFTYSAPDFADGPSREQPSKPTRATPAATESGTLPTQPESEAVDSPAETESEYTE